MPKAASALRAKAPWLCPLIAPLLRLDLQLLSARADTSASLVAASSDSSEAERESGHRHHHHEQHRSATHHSHHAAAHHQHHSGSASSHLRREERIGKAQDSERGHAAEDVNSSPADSESPNSVDPALQAALSESSNRESASSTTTFTSDSPDPLQLQEPSHQTSVALNPLDRAPSDVGQIQCMLGEILTVVNEVRRSTPNLVDLKEENFKVFNIEVATASADVEDWQMCVKVLLPCSQKAVWQDAVKGGAQVGGRGEKPGHSRARRRGSARGGWFAGLLGGTSLPDEPDPPEPDPDFPEETKSGAPVTSVSDARQKVHNAICSEFYTYLEVQFLKSAEMVSESVATATSCLSNLKKYEFKPSIVHVTHAHADLVLGIEGGIKFREILERHSDMTCSEGVMEVL